MTTAGRASLPLAGVRIVSLESFVAAPYGTLLLAGLGAEVIKVEHAAAGGDAARHIGADRLGEGNGCYFQSLNLCKRSVTLDLMDPRERGEFERLVASADAVVENLRGNKAAELGIDYGSLRHLNESLVCLHISGYGRDNDRRSWPGFDYLMQAEAGLMSLTGEPGTPPSRFGVSVIDSMTGVVGMVGLLAALRHAALTGQGGDVDTNLFDVALHQLSYAGTAALNGNRLPGRQSRSGHQVLTPVQTFTTADGWLFVMCMTQGFWLELTECLDARWLKDDARFATMEERRHHCGELQAELDAIFGKECTETWVRRLAGKVPIAPVLEVDGALRNPFVSEQGMIEEVQHPDGSAFRVLGHPIKVDGYRPAQKAGPLMGADNDLLPSSWRSGD